MAKGCYSITQACNQAEISSALSSLTTYASEPVAFCTKHASSSCAKSPISDALAGSGSLWIERQQSRIMTEGESEGTK